MTMTSALPIDVILGMPEPDRGRWQPLRAGILNLYLYDEQVFAFHHGRLLLRGNNGTGKSMALEVLLPYLLDADLTPSRLSTFGGRDRNMHLWLIGFDKSGTRTSERGSTWVEFGRRLPDGASEYFTVGALIEGTRDSKANAHYFTTAARMGIHFSIGRPGSEPLSPQQLAAELAAQAAAGRPGALHPDGEAHRAAVNDALYRLSPARYAVLRRTLLQLRRPKLSDKLDEKGLNDILRDSLPPVSEEIVEDFAEGFERLDRHSAAVEELQQTLRDLGKIRASYRAYARTASAARADAVAAAESAISTIGEKSNAAQSARDVAQATLDGIANRRGEITKEEAQIRGRTNALTRRDAYTKGQEVEPLRELVTSLRSTAHGAAETARRAETAAKKDVDSAEQATDDAIHARDTAGFERSRAAGRAGPARTQVLDDELAVAFDALVCTDAGADGDVGSLLGDARALITRLEASTREWVGEVEALRALASTARQHAQDASTAKAETQRAQGEASDAEQSLNDALEEDTRVTLEWVAELAEWTESSTQLREGQAPPLPWDPATALERAPRWAAEAAAARIGALLARQQAHLTAAAARDHATANATSAAQRALNVAGLLDSAAAADAEYADAVTAYRDAVTAWAEASAELRRGVPAPNLTQVPGEEIRQAAVDWAARAASTRSRSLHADQATVDADISRVESIIDGLAAQEQHLADGGLPEPEVPSARRASRYGRPGAPLYMLVDFSASVSDADRLGIEAAVVGSGVADAWLSPDGRLLSGDDDRPLLDTQLDVLASRGDGGTLSDVLVADNGSAAAVVPSHIVAAVLARIACSASAQAGTTDGGLIIGRDGTWRAGALTGAHQVDAVTLIGASNREEARLAALADVRRMLGEQRGHLHQLEERKDQVTTALALLDSERDSLPDDDNARRLRRQARDAAGRASLAASDLRDSLGRELLAPPTAVGPDEAVYHASAAALATVLAQLAAQAGAMPAAVSLVTPLRDHARQADTLASAWAVAAESERAGATRCQLLGAAVEQERTAIPDVSSVREARAGVKTATTGLAGARARLATREEEEETAREQASTSASVLEVGLLAAGLSGWLRPGRAGQRRKGLPVSRRPLAALRHRPAQDHHRSSKRSRPVHLQRRERQQGACRGRPSAGAADREGNRAVGAHQRLWQRLPADCHRTGAAHQQPGEAGPGEERPVGSRKRAQYRPR